MWIRQWSAAIGFILFKYSANVAAVAATTVNDLSLEQTMDMELLRSLSNILTLSATCRTVNTQPEGSNIDSK